MFSIQSYDIMKNNITLCFFSYLVDPRFELREAVANVVHQDGAQVFGEEGNTGPRRDLPVRGVRLEELSFVPQTFRNGDSRIDVMLHTFRITRTKNIYHNLIQH